MTADARVTAWLDRLEGLHTAATPGPWAQHPSDGEYVIAGVTHDGGEFDYAADVADTYAYRKRGGLADAAAIVAEHNALPALLALARGVTALAEELDRRAATNDGHAADGWQRNAERRLGEADAQYAAAKSLRRLLADAAPDTAEETA